VNDRVLVVNADDYGLTEATSRAILRAHHDGVVTSTSVLALGSGFGRTAGWLADAPDLGLGAHLAAVGEDPPLLSAREIPTLVDAQGRLRMSWKQFLPLVAARRIDLDDVRREFAAQMELLHGDGRRFDHVDTHQNLHLWPGVRDIVLDLAAERGIRCIRVTRSAERGPVGQVVRRLAVRLERRCAASGWAFPAASTGLDEAGALTADGMAAAISRLGATGAPTAELATHPGEAGDPDIHRYAWGYVWAEELEALCAPATRAAVVAAGFRLGTFADVAARSGVVA
jgi:predicted glycoside hydrolase/deacetylase ChbG (UPF0249 family)